tara:strand:+ start:7863 stop:8282 length:420 start_codon:yes stop_codon:yes gene_type:complete
MLDVVKNPNKNILNFITNVSSNKTICKKKYFFLNKSNIKKKNKLKKIKKYDCIVLSKDDINIFKIISFLIFLIFEIKIKKNFIIVYKFKNHLTANNLLPDWPSCYQSMNLFSAFLKWFKNTFKLFFFYKKIEVFILEKK